MKINCLIISFFIWMLSVPFAGANDVTLEPSPELPQSTGDLLLAEAAACFRSNQFEKAESLIVEYVRNQKEKHPAGYTFGFDAAKAMQENLNNELALIAISGMRKHFLEEEDRPILQGVEAALLDSYAKTELWSEAVRLVEENAHEQKTNFLMNMSVFQLNKTLLAAGKTNETAAILQSYYGGSNLVTDPHMPVGFWMESAAETAFSLQKPAWGFELLSKIESSFPEHYQSNQVRFLLMEVYALEEMKDPKNAAQKLSQAHELVEEGAPAGVIEKEAIQSKLSSYRKSGWLNESKRPVPRQLRSRAEASKKSDFLMYTVGSLFILPLFYFTALRLKKRKR